MKKEIYKRYSITNKIPKFSIEISGIVTFAILFFLAPHKLTTIIYLTLGTYALIYTAIYSYIYGIRETLQTVWSFITGLSVIFIIIAIAIFIITILTL